MKNKKILSICLGAALLIGIYQSEPASCTPKKIYKSKISKTYSKTTNLETLIEQGKYEQARKKIYSALAENPSNAPVRAALGSLLSAQYKLGAAKIQLKKALSIDSTCSEAHNALGMVYYRKTTSSDMTIRNNTYNYYDKALNEFKKAIQFDSENFRAFNNAGKIYQETDQLQKSEEYYRKALKINPNYSEALKNLGTVLFAKNQINDAIKNYYKAVNKNSKNSSAYYHLGEALIEKGSYSRAIKCLNKSLILHKNSAPVHNMLGKAYELQGNQVAAITEYKKANLIKPEYTYSYLNIANLYNQRGDQEMAISELKNAISVNPDFLEGKLKVADISLDIGNTDQSIKYYKSILNNPIYSKDALKGLAKAYFKRAQTASVYAETISSTEYIKAQNEIQKAIKCNPKDLQLYLALLRISKLTNNDNNSKVSLSKILNNTSNKPINCIIKGEALLSYNRNKEAKDEFQKALNFTNGQKNLLNIGEILILNRQYDSAKQAYNRVLMIDPVNKKALKSLEIIRDNEQKALSSLNIAKGFYNEGQYLAAIEPLRKSVDLDPNLTESQLLLAKCFDKKKYYANAIDHYIVYLNLTQPYGKDHKKYSKKIKRFQKKITTAKKKRQPLKYYVR